MSHLRFCHLSPGSIAQPEGMRAISAPINSFAFFARMKGELIVYCRRTAARMSGRGMARLGTRFFRAALSRLRSAPPLPYMGIAGPRRFDAACGRDRKGTPFRASVPWADSDPR